jgi:hypothetical protein
MPEIKQGLNLGDLLKYEAPNLYSRDRVTVTAGQVLALGTVLGQVTASGDLTALDPDAVDGSAVAVGVLLQAIDATAGARSDGLMVARHAILADHALTWPAAITPAEQATAIAQLKTRGLLVRQGV